MAVQRGLATPSLVINDQVVPYVAGTLEFKDGKGETQLRRLTAGGRAGVNVVTKDTETELSMIQFSVATTVESVAQGDSWLLANESGGNVVRLSGEGLTRSYRNCFLTNDPSNSTGAEGVTEFVFKGDPI